VLDGTVPALDRQPTVTGPEENMKAFGKLLTQPMLDDADRQANWNPVVQMYFHQRDAEVGADFDARTVYEYRARNATSDLLGSFNTAERLASVQARALEGAGSHNRTAPHSPIDGFCVEIGITVRRASDRPLCSRQISVSKA